MVALIILILFVIGIIDYRVWRSARQYRANALKLEAERKKRENEKA